MLVILWNCDFNSFDFKNLCNLPSHKCKLPDDDIEMWKHVGAYTGCFTTCGHYCRSWFPRSLWSKEFI